jgi:hypothetical protein
VAAVATRLLADDLFGLDKVMAPGTEIHSEVVGDYEDKTRCMALIARFVEQVGAPRLHRELIDQCLDEMLMNALYDAPVDAQGKHVFSGIPTRTRITQRTQQTVVVQYAHDGRRFAVSVRDAFGSLERHTMLRYLHKCLYSSEQVDRKAGGAGLGLYLMFRSSTAAYFNLLPGIATEAICVFDLQAPKLVLEQVGCFVQQDPGGRTGSGPARRLAARRRSRRWLTAGILVALGVLVALVALIRASGGPDPTQVTFVTVPRGATIELEGRRLGTATDGTLTVGDLEDGRSYQVTARLDGYEAKRVVVAPHAGANEIRFELRALAAIELDSQPTGADVEVDGKRIGSTPLTLTAYAPGTTVTMVFKRVGYRTASARVQVPPVGERKPFVQPLEISDAFVRVHFVSVPAGAEVRRLDQSASTDHTYTPADVFVEANQVQRFTLTMPNHVPLVIEPFTPARGAGALEKGGTLVEGATLRVEASAGGKVTVAGAPHCKEVAVPAECTLAPGAYLVEYAGPGHAKVTRTVTMTSREVTEKF